MKGIRAIGGLFSWVGGISYSHNGGFSDDSSRKGKKKQSTHTRKTLFLFPPVFLQGLGDDPLQLPVDGSKLVGGSLLHRLHRLGIDAKQEGLCVRTIFFFLCHNDYLSNASPKVIEQRFSLEICLS